MVDNERESMNVAIIPARGGSKRIPGKNVKSFAGKPIIAYSIEAALVSGLFERVIVTTDSEEIADTARRFGAETPFVRPSELSDDCTPTAPVIVHAIEWLRNNGFDPEFACCIYATAPFVQPEFLKEGYHMIRAYGCSTSYTVTTFPFPILRALKIKKEGVLEMIWPEYELTRSQDLPDAYHDAGQVYWVDCKKFLRSPCLYASDSRPIVLPRQFVQDIDTLEDWKVAEAMFLALDLLKE